MKVAEKLKELVKKIKAMPAVELKQLFDECFVDADTAKLFAKLEKDILNE